NKRKFSVFIDSKEETFPKKEFELLAFLADKPGTVFSREAILKNVWGKGVYVVERTIDVHVRRIRRKLGEHHELIETIKGVGYRFKEIEE
ncbi:MAG: DNA-binding response regulator, partial [Ignavibacteriales bacterium UTCHB3]